MRNFNLPYCTVIISVVTVIFSFYTAHDITGSFFAKVRVTDLEGYGVRLEHLIDLEFWRLLTSQIIHVKQYHMLFNVISFFILGFFLERYIGAFKMFLLWFISGAAGTVFSTLFGDPPWNLGTGASQAIMGVSALGILLVKQKLDTSKGLKYALAFAIIPAISLDLIFAHYPKPGHLLGFLVGLAISLLYFKFNFIRMEQYSKPCDL